ncbi:hypothetical protein KUV26_13630 [Leisingera daeponensis]|uniref:Uncharacterized protein n=1 Tax=Leisingera daeponensis TaxID=405746 RepID=A0ABS7NK31_9RHOB|nr:hypothetical protein [Leisingera daeponensis]
MPLADNHVDHRENRLLGAYIEWVVKKAEVDSGKQAGVPQIRLRVLFDSFQHLSNGLNGFLH